MNEPKKVKFPQLEPFITPPPPTNPDNLPRGHLQRRSGGWILLDHRAEPVGGRGGNGSGGGCCAAGHRVWTGGVRTASTGRTETATGRTRSGTSASSQPAASASDATVGGGDRLRRRKSRRTERCHRAETADGRGLRRVLIRKDVER